MSYNLSLVALLGAFVLTLLTGVMYISFLNKKMFHQQILEDAPQNHQKKVGTPTTGGVFLTFSAVSAAVVALFLQENVTEQAFIILITFVFYAIVGFLDDFQKISKKQNKGMTPRMKMGFQIVIALLPVLFMMINGHSSVDLFGCNIDLGLLYPLFAVFVIVGTSNAVNLTDGLDGLATTNALIAFLTCTIIAILTKNYDLSIISAAVSGACFGFLYFNKYPAQVFMGDTGSLALGGLLATIALFGKFEFYLLLIGIIFITETMSVILQVTSFKLTGKRIFKMSPIHHHFELLGWNETKIVCVFSVVTFVACLISLKLYTLLSLNRGLTF